MTTATADTPAAPPTSPQEATDDRLRQAVLAGMGTGARVMQQVLRHVLIVSASVHYWRGSNQVEDSEVSVKGVGTLKPGVTGSARWKLLPQEWRDRFQAIDSAVRKLVDSHHAVPFPIPGVRFIPLTKAESLFTRLGEYRQAMDRLADEFTSPENYRALQDGLRASIGNDEAWELVKGLLPSRERLRRKCGVTWVVVPLGRGDVEEAPLADPVGYAREAREATRRMIADSVCALLTEPRQELARSVQTLVTMLEKEGRRAVRSASLANVAAAFDKLRSYEFLADTELLAKIKDAEKQLRGAVPQDLNADRDLAGGLARALRGVLTVAGDAERPLETFSRFSSNLDLD